MVAFALLLTSGVQHPVRLTASATALVLGGLILATQFFGRSRRSDGRRRLAWLLFTGCVLIGALSNLLSVDTGRTIRAAANLALLVALGVGVMGFAVFPLARRRGTDLLRMVLDGIVIGGCFLLFGSSVFFPALLNAEPSAPAPTVLLIPVFDVVIATFATLLVVRSSPAERPVLALTAVGFCGYAVSDFAYAAIVAQGRLFQFGSLVDLGWITGYVLVALAFANPGTRVASSDAPSVEVEVSAVPGTVVVVTLFLVAATLTASVALSGRLGLPYAVVWLAVLLAMVARQIALIVDNETLRRTLERRVLDRNRSLRQVTQQSDLLVNSVGDGIYGVDETGLVTFVNPAAAQALGCTARELIGRPAHAVFHGNRPDGTPYPVESCYITEAIRDAVVTNAEEDTYLRADGREIPVEVTATPLLEAGRAPLGAVVVFRDVTQRREVDRLKSEFVSMVSHELRTPLTAIRGSLGLVSGGALGPLTPPATRMVDIALSSTDRLTRLINDILDIERMESGVIPLDIADHTAQSLVDAAVAQLLVLAGEARVKVVTDVQGRVRTDADRAVQTLINVVGNAIKFSNPGGTVLVVARQRGAFVTFDVADRGRGIPEDKLDQIFARFEQVDSSDSREKGGSGLGLAISRSIVERLGGRISAVNNAGGGSTFTFTLPATPGGADEPADPGAAPGHVLAEPGHVLAPPEPELAEPEPELAEPDPGPAEPAHHDSLGLADRSGP
ncbi:MAG: sensor signal transduction histidine kinase [Friedmanniella sp.]|nr:sensor signal transduction histidine kinase [Friedmanniella sp.]